MGSAVHRTIVVVDVEGFGDRRRTLPHQLGTRAALYRVVERALRAAGVPWAGCHREDRGDGLFVLVPPEVPKTPLVEVLPAALVAALREHNATGPPEQRFRLRLAVHAGEVAFDAHGVTSTSLTTAFRLVDAAPLKQALADSPGTLALVVSGWVFDEVVRHSAVLDAATFRPVEVRVKEVRDTAWVALPDHPYPHAPTVLDRPADDRGAVPRQLPAAPAPFVGRDDEAARIDHALGGPGAAGTVLISAIGGAGGIGKTWLALHWAHRHAERFPDGQLFVDLCGFSPTGEPLPSTEALRGFLDGLGVDPGRVPADLRTRAALYRSLVAGKRLLVVLDNAATVEQVAPLLPGEAGCTVVVTSRRRLDSLVTAHDAHYVNLGVLADTEAHRLLTTRLTLGRVQSEPDAVDHLLDVCGGFPLALAIIAGRARTHPHLPLSALAAELRDEATRLDVLDSDDPAASLPTVLSWSLRALPERERKVFALLGTAPGPDIGIDAAAGLVALPAPDAHLALRRLAQASLLVEDTPGRWRMHDLIRRYAATRAAHDLTEAEREAALRRVVDAYLRIARVRTRTLYPTITESTSFIDVVGTGHVLSHPKDVRRSLDWFRGEYPNLAAAEQVAAERGWEAEVWQFAWVLLVVRVATGRLDDNLAAWRAAFACAGRSTDPTSLLWAHGFLGAALNWCGETTEAEHHLTTALRAALDHGNVGAAAHVHFLLAWRHELAGEDDRAREHAEHCRRLGRQVDSERAEAYALHVLGRCHLRAGDYDQACACFEAAVGLHRRDDDRFGEVEMLDSLGESTRLAGRPGAVEHHRQALVLHRQHGITSFGTDSLDKLGHAHLAEGDRDAARAAWQEALERYQDQHRLNDATRVQQQLHDLDTP
ncbi:tetratricopeptide repeat protein [Actinosynnema sp. NPDC050436]|uniref:ATP-binding protein n=1 Tax=Actinosynnema sp. NPDC050436 TaxID=3155659 RepID=UPI0033CA9C2A